MASPQSPKQPTPKQEAANEDTSQQRLQELARVSTELARIVAKNPNADPNLLRELAASLDETTRKEVIANPNIPIDLLWKLGEEFPEQLLDNFVFSLLLLENPNLPADMPAATLASLLKIDAVPESFLELATSHTDEEVLLVVAMKPNTPKRILKKLTHYGTEVAEAAKLHVKWAGEMSEGWDEAALAAMKPTYLERNSKVEAQLWGVGAISEKLLPVLHGKVLCAIAQNPETPEHILKVLLQVCDGYYYGYYSGSRLSDALAQNPQCPFSILEPLIKSESNEFGVLAAGNPNTPFALLQQFQMQIGRVLHPHTDSDTLRELAMSQWEYIRQGVAAHLNTPQDVLEQLAEDQGDFIPTVVALNKNTPTSALMNLATTATNFRNYIPLFQAIACHPHASAKVLELLGRFFKDCFYGFGMFLDFNPNIPTSLLAELVNCRGYSGGDYVEENIVGHPHTNSDTLRELAISELELIRFCVAIHPKAPQDVLEQLATDQNYTVRMAVALNKNTPTSALDQLATDGDMGLLKAITSHPHASADVLEQLAAVPKDDFYQIREAVALNPNTPKSLLEELALDPAVYNFSKSLAENPNTPVSILKQLTKYPDVQIQRCAQSHLQLGADLNNYSPNYTEATSDIYANWVASKFPNGLELPENIYYCGNIFLTKLPSTDKPGLLGGQIAEILNQGNRRLLAMNPATPLNT